MFTEDELDVSDFQRRGRVGLDDPQLVIPEWFYDL